MRLIHWLYLLAIVMIVSSIALFLKSNAATARARIADQMTPVATVKQIMDGIVMPAAANVFGSVAVIADAKGVEEHQPRTEAEWALVGANAAALIEAGYLLLMGDRLKDKDQWVTRSRAMMDAARIALRATEARDVEALFDAGEAINLSCDMCHTRYQATPAE
jgi:hypothetical protein